MAGAIQPNVETMEKINKPVELPSNSRPNSSDAKAGSIGSSSSGQKQADKIGQKLGQKESGGKEGGGGGGGDLTEEGFKASEIIKTLAGSFSKMSDSEKKSNIKKTNGIFQLDVKNPAGKQVTWTIDLKNDGEVVKGPKGKPDVTINLDDATFLGLADGTLNSQKMFMQGKLKVKGNVMLATKLDGVLKGAKAKL